MPMEVTAYLAGDNSLHANACDAATKDLELLIAASPLAENQPYAKRVLEWLTDDPVTICQRLEEYHAACPKAVEEEAPSETLERTRSSKRGPLPHFAGKSKITVLNGSGDETRIPGGVYWDGENSNFYDADNGKGMGQDFFDDWYGSRLIFPRFKEDALNGINHEGVHDFRDQGEKHGD